MHSWSDNGFHIFPKYNNSNRNALAWVEFELAFYNIEVQHICHYAMKVVIFFTI